jgi:protein-S-isoprenylcysteine O-methyltransferase Ste14
MQLAYRVFGYFGLFSIFGSLLFGFRYDPAAPWTNYAFDILLYGTWAGVHLIMTRDWFKQAVYGSRAGTPIQRQVYIVTTVTTWLAVLWWHRPLPGVGVEIVAPIRFAANVGFLLCVVAFFEGATFAMLDSLLGVPGTALSYTHGAETPLFTEGQYARVRHPMYRAVILASLCGLVIHANLAQVLWSLMICGTFVAFIPIEEGQLIAARGNAYRDYMQKTPWRLMPGVW